MQRLTLRPWVLILWLAGGIAVLPLSNKVLAEEGQPHFGGVDTGRWVLGVRGGFAYPTQSVTDSFRSSTSIGPLVNFQAMYSPTTWLLAGLMIEWERHGVDQERPFIDLGHQDTVSVLPTIELRPVKFGVVSPYLNMSFGVNVNSFGEETGNRISPSNTFAWRVGWGADFILAKRVALNTEMAYKRNDGHATINGARVDEWNASSFGFLVGVKLFF